jgi:cytochrome c553
LRGLFIARRCEHCHGSEGFSAEAAIPNLAGMDRLVMWKQLEDFRSAKRESPVMQKIAGVLSVKDSADLAAYYSMLPSSPDPQDLRAFPQATPGSAHATTAAGLIAAGDAERGIPPCQACHGPVGYKTGAPSLATQNADYILAQLEKFAARTRANDIDMPMRSIAADLTEEERHALAEYYGAGFGQSPASATVHK